MRSRPAWTGVALTLLACALAEASLHLLPPPLPVAMLLLTLLPVAYAGLQGGLPAGLASAAFAGLYTWRFVSFPRLVDPTAEAFQGALIMASLGVAMAVPMAIIGSRQERLQRALRTHAAELERRNEELVQANAALEAFGYVVSHDLKEPVRAIENYLDAASDDYGTPGGREDLAKAREANRRLVRLLQGLLSYSRASSLAASPRPLEVRQVVEGDACRTQYETLLRERGGRLEVAPGIPPVEGDEVILAQLLGNLILNAIRHNPGPAPRVTVRAAEPARPGRVHLVVADNGKGFPQDVVARFAALDVSRPSTLRAGFGLAISHRAAQRLGGSIWLANGPEGGEAHLELPAPREPQADAPTAPATLAKPSRDA